MANREHLSVLSKGVDVWNKWRDENEDIRPDLSGANLRRADLDGINFNSVNLSNAQLERTGLNSSRLKEAILIYANLEGALLESANLDRARLYNANLSQAKFERASLTFTDLSLADLRNGNFFATDFSYAYLNLASINGARLSDANFLNVKMGGTVLANLDLSKVKNLDSVIHSGPSNIGIDTIFKSRGNIPEKFLRGCGVPEEFITYMRSLTQRPIEFYSCFISYSSKDEEFAKRLYNDLQSEGVRCWFAPEDLKIGDRFRVRIDESIRLYDKLLLVLSEKSVSSEWVGDEVEAALEKEGGQGGKVVLFPLRLDDAVTEIKTGWPAKVRRTRHIGDFSDLKNHDSYKKAFERLMRDLKSSENR